MSTTRRTFLMGSFALLAAALAAEAQHAAKMWRIGVLSFTRFPGDDWRFVNELKRELKG